MNRKFWSRLAELWCRLTHSAAMWPAHGCYRCRSCLREYPVPWENSRRIVAAHRGVPAPPVREVNEQCLRALVS